MTGKTNFHKVLSILLCAALLLSYLPLFATTANAAEASSVQLAVDGSTMQDWKSYFLPENGALSTENAGGVWTDKSVLLNAGAFADAKDLQGKTIAMKGTDSFLVALSAIASNMTIVGRGGVPTDTMLVLDVSGSMSDNYNNVAAQLADSANTAIKALLDANPQSRIGVVLYSNTATVLLPLARYSTSDPQGRFLDYTKTGNKDTTETISVNDRVVYDGTTTKPQSVSRTVVNGTYIQGGIMEAMEQFTAQSNTLYENRKPIMVIMTDGAPTHGNNNFSSAGSYNLGDGTATATAFGFLTQLTAAYAKSKIREKYTTEPLFYTLGLALGHADPYATQAEIQFERSIATSVLNPAASTSDINTYWQRYNDADSAATSIRVRYGSSSVSVDRMAGLAQNYVDRYFNADDYAQEGDNTLANALKNAFKAVIEEISLQSAYYPTLVEGQQAHSGYISFVDKIGEYMSVTDVKGIVMGSTLFSGIDLAQNFTPTGGGLGTAGAPTKLGTAMVEAVMARLGIADAAQARELISLAYSYKQLSYNPETGEFSNYIGWYADAAGKYVGFWYDGITAAPPADAVSIVKSYGYFGEVNHHTKSDMMFATVQLRYDIATGEETVSFAIPAALVPVITYKVSLDEKGELLDLTATGSTDPIRLVYEVALDPDIDRTNVKEKVEASYLSKADHTGAKTNVGSNGEVYFYTNQYEIAETADENIFGYGKVNTYSYFRPALENDRYYYQEDTPVYTDMQGTPATEIVPGNRYYHAYRVYTKAANGALATQEVYHELAPETALDAVPKTAGHLYIPAGHVRRDYSNPNYDHHDIVKQENVTQTLPDVAYPFVDIRGQQEIGGTVDYRFVFGSTLGNNGRLTLIPATGIRIQKLFEGTDPRNGDFVFTVTGNVADGEYTAKKTDAAGTVLSEAAVAFRAGAARVTLKAGEAIDILGLPAGVLLTVTEEISDAYVLTATTGLAGGAVTTAANEIKTVTFTNALRGTGNLTVSKEVEHPFAADPAAMANKEFTMEVTLTLDGKPLAERSYQDGAFTTDAQGKIQQPIKLKHGQQLEIRGLPAGTVATVREVGFGAGFVPGYWDNGAEGDGVVTVEAGRTVSVIVVNRYMPKEVYPVNISLRGTKTLEGRDWTDADVYSFVLEQFNFGANRWEQLGEVQTVRKDTVSKQFSFDAVFADTGFRFTEAGTYYYRVREEIGNVAGVSYDASIHSFAVVVADEDMDGQLEISEVVESASGSSIAPSDGVYGLNADFTNVYDPGETDAVIELSKLLRNPTGSALASLAGFTFEITADAGNPAGDPLSSEPGGARSVTTTLAGVARFSLHFSKAGTYHYTVREVDDGKPGYSYSDAVYHITVTTTSTGGVMSADVKATKGGAPSALPLQFENTYLENAKVSLPLDFVSKELDGRALQEGEFSFRLTAASNSLLVDADGKAIGEILGSNSADGRVTFTQPLYFDRVGTYYYDIVEVAGSLSGITYDPNTYRIMVTVTDNGGKLQTAYEVLNVEGDGVTFRNLHTPDPISHAIDGIKQMVAADGSPSARALRYGEFTFLLTPVTDANGTPVPGAQVLTAKNELDGSFVFPEIIYTEAGTYYYLITEENGGTTHLGVTYTAQQLLVAVTVTRDAVSGQLEKHVTVNGAAAPAVLKNTYEASPVKLTLSGMKNITGRPRNETDIYSFELYDEKGLVETRDNDVSGIITFSEMTFDKVGIYNYTIQEVIGTKGGMVYDTSKLLVTVEVLDDHMGQLYTQVSVVDSEGYPRADIIFTNHYQITGETDLVLSGTKTLTGRELADGEFSFALYAVDDALAPVGEALQTVTNQGGAFSFSLHYLPEHAGSTFRYLVKEQHAGETIDGISYSDAEYHITVTVSDDGEGGITAVAEMLLAGEAVESLDFVNHYDDGNDETADISGIGLILTAFLAGGSGLAGTTLLGKKKKED